MSVPMVQKDSQADSEEFVLRLGEDSPVRRRLGLREALLPQFLQPRRCRLWRNVTLRGA